MKIANIYPISNQQFYQNEQLVMILAHLVKKKLYKKSNFNNSQYVIMDNGLFEKQQISTDLQDCIDCAEKSGIYVNEIIIPDAVNDYLTTIELFEKNLPTILKYQHRYKFMFVAQARTTDELSIIMGYINKYKNLNLSVGISKLAPFDRSCQSAIKLYKRCKFPIHFLGIKQSFSELDKVEDIIRSCDSSQLAFIAKNEKDIKNINTYSYIRKGVDIDLENDVLDNSLLNSLTNFL